MGRDEKVLSNACVDKNKNIIKKFKIDQNLFSIVEIRYDQIKNY
jgi:hypothetical protein